MRWLVLFLCLAGCGGVSWDTHVAETRAVRGEMVRSIVPGDTTEAQVVARWGNPYQKIPIGGWTEYVYRSMLGDPAHFVIVTFEFGVAVGVRSTETERCRSDFAPRLPGYGWDTPDIVKPIGDCVSGRAVPGIIEDRYQPSPGSVK